MEECRERRREEEDEKVRKFQGEGEEIKENM